jgi:hypothetical protein
VKRKKYWFSSCFTQPHSLNSNNNKKAIKIFFITTFYAKKWNERKKTSSCEHTVLCYWFFRTVIFHSRKISCNLWDNVPRKMCHLRLLNNVNAALPQRHQIIFSVLQACAYFLVFRYFCLAKFFFPLRFIFNIFIFFYLGNKKPSNIWHEGGAKLIYLWSSIFFF